MGPSLLLLEVEIRTPYLIVHEAKRGVNAPDPQYQLYGEMLAAAWLNWKGIRQLPLSRKFSDATPSMIDNWTFVHGVIDDD